MTRANCFTNSSSSIILFNTVIGYMEGLMLDFQMNITKVFVNYIMNLKESPPKQCFITLVLKFINIAIITLINILMIVSCVCIYIY